MTNRPRRQRPVDRVEEAAGRIIRPGMGLTYEVDADKVRSLVELRITYTPPRAEPARRTAFHTVLHYDSADDYINHVIRSSAEKALTAAHLNPPEMTTP